MPSFRQAWAAAVALALLGTGTGLAAPARAADPLPRIPGRAATADSVTLAVIGDYGSCGVDRSCDNEQAVADLVHSWNADAILTVGDNTYQQGLPAEIVKAQAPYKADIDAGRFFPVMGNHDYGNGCSPESVQPSLDYFRVPAAFVAGFGNGLVDFLNPDANCQTGDNPAILGAYQAAIASSTAAWQLTGAHQPVFSSGKAGNNPDRAWVLQPGVDLVLSGHDHHAEQITTADGYHLAITGNGGDGITPLFGATTGSVYRDASYFGAMRLTVTRDALTAEFVGTDRQVHYSYTLKKDAAGRAYVAEHSPWQDPATGGNNANPVPATDRVSFDTAAGTSDGLSAVAYEDGPFQQATVDGRNALQLTTNPRGGANYLYLHADDAKLSGGPYNATATVQYRSEVAGSFSLQYDNTATGSAYSPSTSVTIAPDQVGQWRTATIPLPNISFTNRQNGASDIRLLAPANLPLAVSGISLAVEQIPSAGTGPAVDAVEMRIGSEPDGLTWIPYESGPAHEITVDGRRALQIDRNTFNSGNNLYLGVDDRYVIGGPYTAMATIEYRSPVSGSFVLQYENKATGQAYQSTDRVQIRPEAVDRWQVVSLSMNSAMFQNRQNGNADMRLVGASNLPLVIGSIRVDLLTTPAQVAARDTVAAAEKAAAPTGGIRTDAQLTAAQQALATAQEKVASLPAGQLRTRFEARLAAVTSTVQAAAEELRIKAAIAKATTLLSGITTADLTTAPALDGAITDLATARDLIASVPAERRGTLPADANTELVRIGDAIATYVRDQHGDQPTPMSDGWLTTVVDAQYTRGGADGLKGRVQSLVSRTATGERVNDAIAAYLAGR
ncbi:metallophosphoesterase [Raineyella sp. LH-20]|uniref:metallophosphoesterase n=1 Tax=Raineyella sp. LH-20 TaxID=3081204 RepID=UPI0029533BC4|nr:metallophosphoesterase [Raineyella sp. LH-20]WOP18149.1 metallophosphoesterase [Raineyella sp. LH-20]